jgi:hypothetical protein
MLRWIVRLFTHGVALAVGFALGVYLLPILTAPKGPDSAALQSAMDGAQYNAEFTRALKGSDFLHWGEGRVSVSAQRIAHEGRLAPGPDYKLYLVSGFVEDEAGFAAARAKAVRIGDVRSFDGFILDVPAGVDVSAYDTVLVWCEAFGEFITAAKYR